LFWQPLAQEATRNRTLNASQESHGASLRPADASIPLSNRH
jgi:hypothetical protein